MRPNQEIVNIWTLACKAVLDDVRAPILVQVLAAGYVKGLVELDHLHINGWSSKNEDTIAKELKSALKYFVIKDL